MVNARKSFGLIAPDGRRGETFQTERFANIRWRQIAARKNQSVLGNTMSAAGAMAAP